MGFLSWTIAFLILAIVAAILGFGYLADVSASIAKVLFVIFLILFLIGLIRPLLQK